MKTILLLAFLLQQSPEEKAIENKISNVKLTVDFQNTPLTSVVDYIRDVSEINILIDGRVDAGEQLITIKVQDLTVKSILKLILSGKGLGYTYENDVVLITSKEVINEKVVLELYDVRDILHPLKHFPGVDLALAPDSIGATFTADDEEETPELPLEELIRTHTGGGTWDDNPNASVALNNGILVVKNTREVHRQVRRLLDIFRRNK